MNSTLEKQSEEYLDCVVCREKTDIPASTPIDKIPNYIDGAGAAHGTCYNSLYEKKEMVVEEF